METEPVPKYLGSLEPEPNQNRLISFRSGQAIITNFFSIIAIILTTAPNTRKTFSYKNTNS